MINSTLIDVFAYIFTAGTPLTRCQKLRKRRLETKRTVIPICTSDGHFQREQCNVNKTKCWCVGKTGKRIPGTKVRHQFPNCYPGICFLKRDGEGSGGIVGDSVGLRLKPC